MQGVVAIPDAKATRLANACMRRQAEAGQQLA